MFPFYHFIFLIVWELNYLKRDQRPVLTFFFKNIHTFILYLVDFEFKLDFNLRKCASNMSSLLSDSPLFGVPPSVLTFLGPDFHLLHKPGSAVSSLPPIGPFPCLLSTISGMLLLFVLTWKMLLRCFLL